MRGNLKRGLNPHRIVGVSFVICRDFLYLFLQRRMGLKILLVRIHGMIRDMLLYILELDLWTIGCDLAAESLDRAGDFVRKMYLGRSR